MFKIDLFILLLSKRDRLDCLVAPSFANTIPYNVLLMGGKSMRIY